MPIFRKHFTVEEANRLLPRLREIFKEIHQILGSMDLSRENLEQIQKAIWGNGGGEKIRGFFDKSSQIYSLVSQIHKMGAFCKDLQRGLVDFPALYKGREVFLCWELGEEQVAFWHDLQSGYAGRKPIE